MKNFNYELSRLKMRKRKYERWPEKDEVVEEIGLDEISPNDAIRCPECKKYVKAVDIYGRENGNEGRFCPICGYNFDTYEYEEFGL